MNWIENERELRKAQGLFRSLKTFGGARRSCGLLLKADLWLIFVPMIIWAWQATIRLRY